MSSTALQKGPRLKAGKDAEAAEQIRHYLAEAQNGLRRVVALGLFCIEIKENQLKHGQFQPWLQAHCPDISYRSLAAYMQLTRSVLEKCGFKTLEAYFSKVQNLHFCHGGEILLLPEHKIPDAAKPIRSLIFEVIDGKSTHQLMLEFKQADEDEEGNLARRRGRTKGCKGTTKEQRQAAREREEQERIEEIEITAGEFCKWMEKVGGPKGVGLIANGSFKKLRSTVEWFGGVLDQLHQQRGEK